ncbi:hypothetical protein TNCV_3098621 [Trichonephila clavipes]|nr:hypothetical protein TNCV_3098621 [Trichonephila clavipes]
MSNDGEWWYVDDVDDGHHRCEEVCKKGTWGLYCSQSCSCRNGARCLPDTGKCICTHVPSGARSVDRNGTKPGGGDINNNKKVIFHQKTLVSKYADRGIYGAVVAYQIQNQYKTLI